MKTRRVRGLSRREKRAWGALLVVSAIGSAAVVWLVSHQLSQSQELARAVASSHQVRLELRSLLSLHQDLEIGQRGFLLTGEPAFLAPYTDARRELEHAFGRLDQTVAPEKMAKLATISRDKLAFSDQTLTLAKAGQREAASSLVANGRGRRLMDDFRTTIATIERSENTLLEERSEAAAAAFSFTRLVVLTVSLVMAALLILAIGVTARAASARAQATARYRKLSARQEAIFRNAHDGMITVNKSGTIEGLNPAIERMTGYTEVELARRDVGLILEVAPDQGRRETFLRRLAQQSQEKIGKAQELQARRKDGSFFPCEVTVSHVSFGETERREAVRGEPSTSETYLAVVRDITDREEVDRMKSEFVSTVSHELRTPLTSIAGSLGLLAGGATGQLSEQAQRLVQIARTNCERLVRLINDILDMEKLEAGSMAMNIRPVELGPFLEEAIRQNHPYAQTLSVDLHLEPFVHPASVYADYDRLMQVMTNLLSNAAKFSPAGQTVEVAVTALDRRWRVGVRDRGAGISEDFQNRVFGKFAQADSADTRLKGGTGLGLSIVREIVTRLGGAVSFESPPDGGTIFYVDIPAAEDGVCHLPNIGRPRVLHVEDDPDVIAIVRAAAKTSFAMSAAHSLHEARAALKHASYDVVILDCGLPDGSGAELIPELRRSNIGIIVFTAQDAQPELENMVEAVLIKSRASLEALVSEVRELLEAQNCKGRGDAP